MMWLKATPKGSVLIFVFIKIDDESQAQSLCVHYIYHCGLVLVLLLRVFMVWDGMPAHPMSMNCNLCVKGFIDMCFCMWDK